ncbi:hypothetical protein QZH41_011985, partial [Actinostola sp. cb2023]
LIAAINSEDNNTTKELSNEAPSLIDERNRKIRIADSSEAGWLTVKHYEASAVALDPDDDKKIRQAEKEALRQKSKAALHLPWFSKPLWRNSVEQEKNRSQEKLIPDAQGLGRVQEKYE